MKKFNEKIAQKDEGSKMSIADRSRQLELLTASLEKEIFDRKSTEEELRGCFSLLNSILNSMGEGILVVNLENRIVTYNMPYKDMWNLPEEVFISGSFEQRIEESAKKVKDPRRFTERALEIYSRPEARSYDLIEFEDGRIFERYSQPHEFGGEIVGRVWNFRDVTARKSAEQRLNDTESRYRSLVEHIPAITYTKSLDGRILYISPQVKFILGYSPAEFRENSSLWSELIHPEDRENVPSRSVDYSDSPITFEYKLVAKGGEEVWLRDEVRIIRDSLGSPVLYQGFALDITRQRELEKQLRHSQKMEAVGVLAGGVAHDFNNMLTIIQGYTDLIMGDKDPSDAEYSDLMKIAVSARKGADLVKRLLTFSRKVETIPSPMDLSKLVAQLEPMLERTLTKMVEIEMRLTDDPALVYGDPAQFEQIVVNLAINSGDAMPHGGKLIIETECVLLDAEFCNKSLCLKPGKFVVLTVTDNGTGMDKSTVEHIFEPFFTTKEVGKGTGLGLSMVYGTVQQYEGYITCQSELDKGTSFKMYFPAVDVETNERHRPKKSGAVPESNTVLIVDDEEFVRDLAVKLLSRAGYRVLSAANGKEALEIYKKHGSEISLVIMDLVMPEMSGEECLEKIIEIDPDAHVLIASGYPSDVGAGDILRTKAVGFVQKPYDTKKFLDAVKEAF